MRHLFNVLYSAHTTIQPEIVISLNAEKAFDLIEWTYLFTVLERFGFGPQFCSWIKILYTSTMVSVRTNIIISDYQVNQLALKINYGSSPFKTEQQRFTYLGIHT